MRRTLILLACIIAHSSGFAADVATPASVVATHAELARRSYGEALVTAQALASRIEAFLAAPSADGLDQARAAWRQAHDAYCRTEVFRFQDGPIDGADGPEGLINGWPLDEQYLDATVDAPGAGLIQRSDVPLTRDGLFGLHEAEGEKHLVLGFHAIEFLLWGQDLRADGPGDRPVSDFTSAAHAERRGVYLRLAAAILIEHLTQVTSAWEPGPGTYGERFVAGDPAEGLRAIFTGLAMLAGFELAGERLAVAYETQDQEEEQSCFSDHTHANTRENIAGLAMVWRGVHGEWRGPALRDLVAAADVAAAKAVDEALVGAIAAAAATPEPFDQAILGEDEAPGRRAVLATIEALELLGQRVVAAGASFGLEIPMSEPEAE